MSIFCKINKILLDEKSISTLVKYAAVVLLVTYFAQGILYPAKFFVAKIALMLYYIIGIFCMFKVLIYKPKQWIVYTITLFLIINIAYFCFSDESIVIANYSLGFISVLKKIFFIFISLYIFYYLAYNKAISNTYLIIIYSIYFVLGIVKFFSLSPFSQTIVGEVNNYSYIFVNLLPFIFLIRKKIFAIILLAISILLVIVSLKRGAIIITAIFSIYYIFTMIKDIKLNFTHKIVVTIAILLIGSWSTWKYYSNNEVLQNRINQTISGNSSGRADLYMAIWEDWENSDNLIQTVFGKGFASTPIVTDGRYAHNDWLELLSCNGLFGVAIYAIILLQMLLLSFNKKYEATSRYIILSVFVIWMLKTLFSMGFTDIESVPLMIILGYTIGYENRKNDLEQYESNICCA